jgi:hypothetical protein
MSILGQPVTVSKSKDTSNQPEQMVTIGKKELIDLKHQKCANVIRRSSEKVSYIYDSKWNKSLTVNTRLSKIADVQ